MNRPYRIALLVTLVVCVALISQYYSTRKSDSKSGAPALPRSSDNQTTLAQSQAATVKTPTIEPDGSKRKSTAKSLLVQSHHKPDSGGLSKKEAQIRGSTPPKDGLGDTIGVMSRSTRVPVQPPPVAKTAHAKPLKTARPTPTSTTTLSVDSSPPPQTIVNSRVQSDNGIMKQIGQRGSAKGQTMPQPTVQDKTPTYVVQLGDTFSSIAVTEYGSYQYWIDIKAANPMANPHRLMPGQVIKLPGIRQIAAQNVTQSPALDGSLYYTVRPGDTLSKIAVAHYGNSAQWQKIYRANRVNIGPDPNDLEPGITLKLVLTERDGPLSGR